MSVGRCRVLFESGSLMVKGVLVVLRVVNECRRFNEWFNELKWRIRGLEVMGSCNLGFGV
jgi:hypothetical protein